MCQNMFHMRQTLCLLCQLPTFSYHFVFWLRIKRLDRVWEVGVPPTLVLFIATPQTQYREHLYINGTFICTLYLINQNIYSLSCKLMFVIQPFYICANPSFYLNGLKSNAGNIYSYFHLYFANIHRHHRLNSWVFVAFKLTKNYGFI